MAKQGGTIVTNNELNALNRISKELDTLTPEARKRAFAWLNDREQQSTPTTSDSSTAPGATANVSGKGPS